MEGFFLKIYDIAVKVNSDSSGVLDALRKDFFLYLFPEEGRPSGGLPVVHLKICKGDPPYERVPPLEASLHDLDLICYKDGAVNYTDYSGKGLLIYDFGKEQGELYGGDELFLYDKAKLTILSRLGDLWEKKGIRRIHAVGLSKDNVATVCFLPMGGGKTTTGLNVIRRDRSISLLADDMCLIDAGGDVRPFLIRIGVRDEGLLEGVPAGAIEEVNRQKYGRKFLIDAACFVPRLADRSRLKNLLIGKRVFRPASQIRPVSKIKILFPFMASGVFGLGLPQLIEFFFRGDFRFFLRRAALILSRTVFLLRLLARTKVYEFYIGRDRDGAAAVLTDFINGRSSLA